MNHPTIPSRDSALTTMIRTGGLIVLFATAVAAIAQQSPGAGSAGLTRIPLADLDLATSAGIAAARNRLHQSARQFCSQQVANLDALHWAEFASCMDNTLIRELKQLSSSARTVIVAKGSAWPTPSDDDGRPQLPASAPETSVMAVSIADLDLLSPDGMRVARQRIRNTAKRICSQLGGSQDPASRFVKCVDDTTSGALRQIQEAAFAANEEPLARSGAAQ